MDSCPPARITWLSPARMDCAASITALSPEPHTLLMVSAETWSGRPALIAACRAGACPTPPCTTLPMMTSAMSCASIPDRATASRRAMAPSSGAESDARAPRNLPMGVRTALTITGVVRGSRAISIISSL